MTAADLDTALARCLDARGRGEPLEHCLAGLAPVVRRELEPLVRLADVLREAERPSLSPATVAYQEQRLLAQVGRLRSGSQPVLRGRPRRVSDWVPAALPSSWRRGLAAAMTLFLLAGSVVLAGGAGALVSNAGPEDALYSWKLSWEQTQLLLSGNDAQRARVYLGVAQARIKEIEELARQGRPIPEELLLQVRLSVNQAIALTAGLGANEAIPLLRQLSELLAYERVLLGQFLATLPEPDRATVELALVSVQASEHTVSQAIETHLQQTLPPPTLRPTPQPTPTALPEPTLGARAESPRLQPATVAPVLEPKAPAAVFADPLDVPPADPAASGPAAGDPPARDDWAMVVVPPAEPVVPDEAPAVELANQDVKEAAPADSPAGRRPSVERTAARPARREVSPAAIVALPPPQSPEPPARSTGGPGEPVTLGESPPRTVGPAQPAQPTGEQPPGGGTGTGEHQADASGKEAHDGAIAGQTIALPEGDRGQGTSGDDPRGTKAGVPAGDTRSGEKSTGGKSDEGKNEKAADKDKKNDDKVKNASTDAKNQEPRDEGKRDESGPKSGGSDKKPSEGDKDGNNAKSGGSGNKSDGGNRGGSAGKNEPPKKR